MVSAVIEGRESTSVERQGSEFKVSFMTGKVSVQSWDPKDSVGVGGTQRGCGVRRDSRQRERHGRGVGRAGARGCPCVQDGCSRGGWRKSQ